MKNSYNIQVAQKEINTILKIYKKLIAKSLKIG